MVFARCVFLVPVHRHLVVQRVFHLRELASPLRAQQEANASIQTDPISVDLNVPFESQSWVITAYAVTFAAFLLFWGRVSDLYSAKPVFAYGFMALGVLDLVISCELDRCVVL